jgi:acyl-coenzyme A synthetase/AMP-(fatty) acid ligase
VQPQTSTCQYIVYHAHARPNAAALIHPDGSVTSYAALAVAVAQHVQALEAMDVIPGALVGMECPDRHQHLLLVLACHAIGAGSVSFSAADLASDDPLVQRCDLVLHSEGARPFPARRAHCAGAAWLAQVGRLAVTAHDRARLVAPPDPQQIQRLIRTSGTTGERKTMVVPAAIQDLRVRQQYPMAPGPRNTPVLHQSLYNFTMGGALNKVCGALHLGATTLFSSLDRFIDDMLQYRTNHAMFLVGDAERVLTAARLRPVRPQMSVNMIGSTVPPQLRAELLARIAVTVENSYSSNEAGRAAMLESDGTGTILPEVEVAIRGEDGTILPDGEAGLISIRSPLTVPGYIDNPALTARHFRDGWFHTSDWGRKPAPGRLQVYGRADDMLNIGGVKIPAPLIEVQAKRIAGVADAAVLAVTSQNGVAHLATMLELQPGAEAAAVTRDATALLARYSTCRLALSHSLPRTETGKIRKPEIAAWFRRDMGFDTR